MATVECLDCGNVRSVDDTEQTLGVGACPRCGYVGWALSAVLSETDRRLLRDVPVSLRTAVGSPAADVRPYDLFH
jgi:hypothetical protein